MRFQRPQSGWSRGGTLLACALLVAVALSLACPAAALAAPTSLAPRTRGSILIRYSKDYASYDVYRLFDLAMSTNDGAAQDDITYAYVIKETIASGAGTRPNPWWTFLTTYGPDGKDSASPYAVLSSASSSKKASALFILDAQSLTLGGDDGYHEVSMSERYTSFNDFITRSTTATGEASGSDATKLAQNFAKAALAFAEAEDLSWRLGRYEARGRETYGNTEGQANTDSVYQYSGDTAYVTNIPLGVYLLGVNEGMLCSMSMGNSSALVYDRKEYPELFVQVRAKDAPAVPTDYAQQDSAEQHDLVWSEDNLMRWAYRTDVNLGAVVQFKTVIIAQEGVTDYRLHQVLEDGLTFLDAADGEAYSPHVYIHNQETDATYEVPSSVDEKTNWVLHTTGEGDGPADGCDFEIEFKDVAQTAADEDEEKMTFAYAATGEDGSASLATADVSDWDRIVVTYWVHVNDHAIVYGSDNQAKTVKRAKDLSKVKGGADGSGERLPVQTHTATDGNNRNTNSAVLTYGDDSHTTWARAEVASYQFDVVRAGAPASSGVATGSYPLLAGAEFALYKTVDEGTVGATAYTAEVNMAQKTYYYVPDRPLLFMQDGSVYTCASGNAAATGEDVQVEASETSEPDDGGSSSDEASASGNDAAVASEETKAGETREPDNGSSAGDEASAGEVQASGNVAAASEGVQAEASETTDGSSTSDELPASSESSPAVESSPAATTPLTTATTSSSLTPTLTSSSESVIRVRGIEAGVYLLVETKAPDGSTSAQPSIVTIHSRAYYNNDPVEDSTPGLRHTNTEGNITVTTFTEGRNSTTNVVGWKAKVTGSPATYEKARSATTSGGQEILSNGKSASVTNGGVLVSERANVSTRASNGVNPLVLCVVGLAIAGAAAAVMWVRRGVS